MDSSTAKIIQTLSKLQPVLDRYEIKIAVNNYADFVPAFMREEALEWILNLESGPYAAWIKIWNMQSEEHWKRYLLWEDFADYREVKMLKAAEKELKTYCKKLPALFSKRKCVAAINEMNKR
jgi:hypothetical protein